MINYPTGLLASAARMPSAVFNTMRLPTLRLLSLCLNISVATDLYISRGFLVFSMKRIANMLGIGRSHCFFASSSRPFRAPCF